MYTHGRSCRKLGTGVPLDLAEPRLCLQRRFTCGILGFFIYNMLKNPDRYGTAPVDQSRSVGPLDPRPNWPSAVRVDFDVAQRTDKEGEDRDAVDDSRTDLGIAQ